MSGDELFELVCAHQKYGFWRAELDTGSVYWSFDIYDIYGMEYSTGPVNLLKANQAIHPDDLPYMLELMERTAQERTGHHFIVRLKTASGRYTYVRSVGRFRVTEEGREELYGIFIQFHDRVPLVGITGQPHLPNLRPVAL
nr:PAS domain-containing protein [Pseudohoeflea sp. DP4N28-3]